MNIFYPVIDVRPIREETRLYHFLFLQCLVSRTAEMIVFREAIVVDLFHEEIIYGFFTYQVIKFR